MESINLGNDRYVNVCEWKDEKRSVLKEVQPSKKGITLTLNRWKNFMDILELVDDALH